MGISLTPFVRLQPGTQVPLQSQVPLSHWRLNHQHVHLGNIETIVHITVNLSKITQSIVNYQIGFIENSYEYFHFSAGSNACVCVCTCMPVCNVNEKLDMVVHVYNP